MNADLEMKRKKSKSIATASPECREKTEKTPLQAPFGEEEQIDSQPGVAFLTMVPGRKPIQCLWDSHIPGLNGDSNKDIVETLKDLQKIPESNAWGMRQSPLSPPLSGTDQPAWTRPVRGGHPQSPSLLPNTEGSHSQWYRRRTCLRSPRGGLPLGLLKQFLSQNPA